MSRKKDLERFDRMVAKAAQLHVGTWCVKRHLVIPTAQLKGEECLNCREFILNGGACDPL